MREEVERLITENETLKQSTGQELPDLEEIRDRVLKSLKLGTQAPGYKIARKALDQFIRELTELG